MEAACKQVFVDFLIPGGNSTEIFNGDINVGDIMDMLVLCDLMGVFVDEAVVYCVEEDYMAYVIHELNNGNLEEWEICMGPRHSIVDEKDKVRAPYNRTQVLFPTAINAASVLKQQNGHIKIIGNCSMIPIQRSLHTLGTYRWVDLKYDLQHQFIAIYKNPTLSRS